MNNKFASIKNKELHEILKYVKAEPIFFSEGMRLLSEEEIINYKEELDIVFNNIIPLIDLYDNDFLIYNINETAFEKLNIVDGTFFGKTDTIKKYLELLKEYE